MATIVARLYASADKAAAAVKDLRNYGYGDSEIFVTAPSASASAEDLAASVAQSGVSKTDAAAYAAEIAKGATLVVVHAAFGAGVRTTAALNKHDPMLSPVKASAPAPVKAMPSFSASSFASQPYDEAAPLSSFFQWKTLLSDPTPFSSYFKFETLSDFSFSRKFGFAELSDDAAPLSKKFGWPLLRDDDPTPLSTKFNWPVLRE